MEHKDMTTDDEVYLYCDKKVTVLYAKIVTKDKEGNILNSKKVKVKRIDNIGDVRSGA